MKPLRLSLIQTRTHWHDWERNLDHFDALMAPLAGATDAIVLTETFTTGFTQHPQQVAQTMDGPAVRWLRRRSAELGAALTGSLAIEEHGRYYNRMLWATPEGDLHVYDKRHLFGLGGEHERYAAGGKRVVFAWRGWRICPMVCYDLRFPVWVRSRSDYDLLVFVANWPGARVRAWSTLLRARAIENQSYVVGVNRVGTDGNGIEYPGCSVALDPLGEALADLGDEERVATVQLDPAALAECRQRLPFLADADRFELLDRGPGA